MDQDTELEALGRKRWRVGLALTGLVVLMYFGFVLTVAFNREALAQLVTRGLSLGILLGAVIILVAWLLTGAYVYWANRRYDAELERHRGRKGA